MSLARNIALMGTSTAVRLAFGMLTFVVMARLLGPASFGTVMLWLSVSTLLALVANYGLTPFLLKEIGANPSGAEALMGEVLTAKLLLTASLAVLGLLIATGLDGVSRAVFLLLLAAQLADSLTEFLNVGFRATNRFAEETRTASVGVVIQFVIVAGVLAWQAHPIAAAAAFMASRLAVLLLVWRAQRGYFAGLRLAPVATAVARLKATRAYAADFALQSLLGQVDSVVLNHFVGPAAVGLYQAGMRLFNGGAQAAGVLANVFLPRAAAAASAADGGRGLQHEAARVQWAFLAVGGVFGLALCVLAQPLVHLLFGESYRALVPVLPWFGFLFYVRFFASSWGVLLTSAGAQTFRAVINAVHWAVIGAASLFLVPSFGLIGWLVCLALGNAILSAAYVWRGFTLTQAGWGQPAVALFGLIAFLPFLQLPH